jgi:multidrug efflux pump subunit AcrB
MNFSAWAIRRPLPALMIFFVLCVAGLYGFHELPIARFPDVSFPMVTVNISLPGASPSQLETEVTRKVEDSVATATGIKRVMSTVNEGVSSTAIEFVLETDLSTALDEVRDAVTRIRSDLPQDIQEPVIAKVNIGGSLMTYAVGSRSTRRCMACPASRWSRAPAASIARSASISTRRPCRPTASAPARSRSNWRGSRPSARPVKPRWPARNR